jgi:hypothetical protein
VTPQSAGKILTVSRTMESKRKLIKKNYADIENNKNILFCTRIFWVGQMHYGPPKEIFGSAIWPTQNTVWRPPWLEKSRGCFNFSLYVYNSTNMLPPPAIHALTYPGVILRLFGLHIPLPSSPLRNTPLPNSSPPQSLSPL